MGVGALLSAALFYVSIVQIIVAFRRLRKYRKQLGDRDMGQLMYALCHGNGRQVREAASVIVQYEYDERIELLARHYFYLIEAKTAKYVTRSLKNPKWGVVGAAVQILRSYRAGESNILYVNKAVVKRVLERQAAKQREAEEGLGPYSEPRETGQGQGSYREQREAEQNPYISRRDSEKNPYVKDRESTQSPYNKDREPGKNPYNKQLEPGRRASGQREYERRLYGDMYSRKWDNERKRALVILVCVAAIAAVGFFLYIPNASKNDSDLTRFYYGMRHEWGEGYTVSVTRSGGEMVVDYYRGIERWWERDKDNIVAVPLSDEQYEELLNLISARNLALWNGWGKNNAPLEGPLERAGFVLNIEWGNGKTVIAENNTGFAKTPFGFKKTDEAIYDYFTGVVGKLSKTAMFEEEIATVRWIYLYYSTGSDARDTIRKYYDIIKEEEDLFLKRYDRDAGTESEAPISDEERREMFSIFKKHNAIVWDGAKGYEYSDDDFSIYIQFQDAADEESLQSNFQIIGEGPEGFAEFRDELIEYLDSIIDR